MSCLPLVLFWLSFLLLGWYLSASHLLWLAGTSITLFVLAIALKPSSWIEMIIHLGSQGGWTVILLVLMVSFFVSLAASWSMLWVLFFLPLLTTFLAVIDMKSANVSQFYLFLVLIVLAALGLGIGELIDLTILPSMRY